MGPRQRTVVTQKPGNCRGQTVGPDSRREDSETDSCPLSEPGRDTLEGQVREEEDRRAVCVCWSSPVYSSVKSKRRKLPSRGLPSGVLRGSVPETPLHPTTPRQWYCCPFRDDFKDKTTTVINDAYKVSRDTSR